MIPKLEDCNPGFDPVEYNVVIAVEEGEKVRPSGLIVPDQTREADRLASMRGLLVSVSPHAFNYDEWPADARKPQPGDEVLFAKFGGVLVTGEDGNSFRVCKDRDLIAIYRAAEKESQ